MALLNQLIDFDPIIDKLWEKFEPKLDAELANLREQVVALLPVIGAAAAKAISGEFPNLIRGILEKDPDIPVLSDIVDVSEMLRGDINESSLPIHIPVLSDILKGLGGR